jgi:hypothetical protein
MAICAFAACIGFALSTQVSPAAAHSGNAPAVPSNLNSGGHWWKTNNCTFSPDTVFKHACIHHDGCYIHRWSQSKGTCDTWFRNDMRATCSEIRAGLSCYVLAEHYYAAVTAYGWPAWFSRGFFY